MDFISEQPGFLVFSSGTTIAAMTDDSLLLAAASGDETAFRQLYERHCKVVFYFAYRLLQSIELAEEITQDCFLSLIRKPARFDARKATLKTYLCAAARNQAIKHLQRNGRNVQLDDLQEEPIASANTNPLHQVIGAELSALVRQAIADLPLLQREALILFEYEGLSLAEIAAVVNADVGTVKSRLHRARERLRIRLAGYVSSGEQVAL